VIRRHLRHLLGAIAVLAIAIGAVAAGTGDVRAAAPVCNGKAMYIVAHQDDTLLFQSPALLQEIQSGRCVQSVFLTAGDAGREATYWHEREVGSEAAYAVMAGVPDEWEGSTTTIEGKALTTRTLKGAPGISLIFMRLPDGNLDGEGYARYGNQSLLKLWRSANPGHGSPSITSITADDGSATYTYPQLLGTLEGLIAAYEPRLIATQNFNEALPEHLPGPDHPDHLVTAYMVRTAQESYAAPHQLIAYKDYDVSASPPNVTGTLLGAKQAAFFAYGMHDDETCVDEKSCDETSEYGNWLRRQYTTGKVTTGVVAQAGYAQEALPSASVALDGSRSSAQSGGALSYAWTQTKGPTVTLSSATAAKPTFTTPSHPTLLRFRLVVSDGSQTSAPDEVTVRVPASDPTPVAVVGPPQTVASGASVALEGSASYDPNSEPLSYAWLQVGGPTVTLSGATTPTPSFTAPAGPASLVFALTVSNGTETSAPANVTVTVKGTPPAFTSAAEATFSTAAEGSFTVGTTGSPAPAITRTAGTLPAGVTLTDNGDGTATLAGRPAVSSAPPGGTHKFEFTLRAKNSEGEATQAFALTVVNPGQGPSITSAASANADVGKPVQLALVSAGEPTPVLSLASGALPPGLTFTAGAGGTATIAGTPTADAAPAGGSTTYQVELRATNAVGSVGQTVTITVRGVEVPAPPTPTPPTGDQPPASSPPPSGGGSPPPPAAPQPKLSRGAVALKTGRAARKVVTVKGSAGASVTCRGHLPPGARCRVLGGGRIAVEARPSLRRVGTFKLTVRVSAAGGTAVRTLTVKIAKS
jgi:LmbE family N-acetylglucosaminyl deacetylase